MLLINLTAPKASPFVETYYASAIYPAITTILTHLTNWAPFSITEFLIALFVIFVIAGSVLAIFRKWPLRNFLTLFVKILAIAYVCFYVFWGFNYYRLPIVERIGLPPAAIDSTLFRTTLEHVLDETNAAYLPFERFDKKRVDRAVEHGFARAATLLGIELPAGKRAPKTLVFNHFFDKTLTSGFFSPLTHELHLNKSLLDVEYPFTLAHEKSHQMGIANEAEASFLAYLVCILSDDPFVEYSGRMEVLGEFLGRGRRVLPDYPAFRDRVAPGILDDFRAINRRWRQHRGTVSQVSSRAYDRYLKANRIAEGVQNYRGVVEMVILWKMAATNAAER